MKQRKQNTMPQSRRTPHTTRIVLDPNLIQQALKLSGLKTQRALIHLALEEFVHNHEKPSIRDLKGMGGLYQGYDYKALRQNPHSKD